MSAKINSAESIRGLACLAVVFSHLAMSFFPFLHHFDPNEKTDLAWVYAIHHLPFGFLYSGDAAVFVFFVLSGYVLSYAILKSPEQFLNKIKMMMVKRYPRLMIPALTSCLIFWVVLKFSEFDSSHVGAWLQAFTVQDFGLLHTLSSAHATDPPRSAPDRLSANSIFFIRSPNLIRDLCTHVHNQQSSCQVKQRLALFHLYEYE